MERVYSCFSAPCVLWSPSLFFFFLVLILKSCSPPQKRTRVPCAGGPVLKRCIPRALELGWTRTPGLLCCPGNAAVHRSSHSCARETKPCFVLCPGGGGVVGGVGGWPCFVVSELHVSPRPRKITLNLCHRCIRGLGRCVGFSSIVEIPPSCFPPCASHFFLHSCSPPPLYRPLSLPPHVDADPSFQTDNSPAQRGLILCFSLTSSLVSSISLSFFPSHFFEDRSLPLPPPVACSHSEVSTSECSPTPSCVCLLKRQ